MKRTHPTTTTEEQPQPLILLTGARGSGKSTVCARAAQLWRERGGVPAGLLTRTAGPHRWLVDIATGEERILAAEGELLDGPRWGRFSFSRETLDWGNAVMRRAVAGPADLVLLDEIGPLEMAAGEGLLPALQALLGGCVRALVVVRPELLEQLRALAGARPVRTYEVTMENREKLPAAITGEECP